MNALLRQRLGDAAHVMIGSLLRHLFTIVGTALVTRGLIDQGSVDGIIPMAVEVVAGAILAAAATGWGQFRAFVSHTRWARAWAALTAAPVPPAGALPPTS